MPRILRVRATRNFQAHIAGDILIVDETAEIKKLIKAKLFEVLAVEKPERSPAPAENVVLAQKPPRTPAPPKIKASQPKVATEKLKVRSKKKATGKAAKNV